MSKNSWFRHAIGLILLALVVRKVLIGREAMRVVDECQSQIEVFKMVSLNSLQIFNSLILLVEQYVISTSFSHNVSRRAEYDFNFEQTCVKYDLQLAVQYTKYARRTQTIINRYIGRRVGYSFRAKLAGNQTFQLGGSVLSRKFNFVKS